MNSQRNPSNRPLSVTFKAVDSRHPYLKERGIFAEVAQRFGVGYFAGNGSMAGRIVFPIRNRRGEIVAYAGQAIDAAVEPIWKFSSEFQNSFELFGLHEAADNPVIVLVESPWCVLALNQAEVPAIALMSCSISQDQQRLLASLGPVSLVVLLDGDEPARSAAASIALRLMRQHFVRVVDPPQHKQLDQLGPDELLKLLELNSFEPCN